MVPSSSSPTHGSGEFESVRSKIGRAAWLAQATLEQIGHGVCVTDTWLDSPGPVIEFVNDAYLDIFCCTRDDVIGRSPRLGQGPLTDRRALARIREQLVVERAVHVQAINYRIDRTPFRLRWSIDPLRDDGELVGFVALLTDTTVEDRVRRRLSALDALMSRGRPAISEPRSSRRHTIANALADALTPLLDEIGHASVTCGADPVRTRSVCASKDRNPDDVLTFDHGLTVALSIHPDGVSLLDRVAVEELCEHALWLLGLADRG